MTTECSKGQGIVLPRQKDTSRGKICPFRVDAKPAASLTRLSRKCRRTFHSNRQTLALRQVEEGERETDVQPRFPAYLVDDWVERKNAKNQKEEFEALAHIRHSTPVILSNTDLTPIELLQATPLFHALRLF